MLLNHEEQRLNKAEPLPVCGSFAIASRRIYVPQLQGYYACESVENTFKGIVVIVSDAEATWA